MSTTACTPDPGCDFCGRALTGLWTAFVASPMMRSASTADGRVIEAIYGTDWYACRTCEPLVAGRRWRDLLDRAENGQLRRMGYRGRRLSIARAEVAALWLALERHLTGERVRVAGTPEGRR